MLFAAYNVNAITVTSTASGGSWSNTTTWVGNVVPTAADDVVINGSVVIGSTTTVNNLTVNSGGGLFRSLSGSPGFIVTGDFINNGIIGSNKSINFSISGDVTVGTSINGSLTLNGTGTQNLTVSNALDFDLIINKSSGKVECQSSLVLDASISVNLGILDMNGNDITLNNGRRVSGSGTIEAVSNIYDNSTNSSNTWSGLTIDGNVSIHGALFSNNLTINGNLTIIGIIRNRYSTGSCGSTQYYLNVSGDITIGSQGTLQKIQGCTFNVTSNTITNNGTIDNLSGTLKIDGNLINNNIVDGSLYITGNVLNNGSWTSTQLYLNGTTPQTLETTVGNTLQAYLQVQNDILAGSDLLLIGMTFSSGKELDMGNYNLNIVGSSVNSGTIITNGVISGSSSLVWSGTTINGNVDFQGVITINYITITGNVTITGTVKNKSTTGSCGSAQHFLNVSGDITIGSQGILKKVQGCTFNVTSNTITNNGTIDNQSGTLKLIINGDVTNNGTVTDAAFDITDGDITNDGTWSGSSINIYGNANQTINLLNNSTIQSNVYLHSDVTGTTYQWQKSGANITANGNGLSLYLNGLSNTEYGNYTCQSDSLTSRIITIGDGSPPLTYVDVGSLRFFADFITNTSPNYNLSGNIGVGLQSQNSSIVKFTGSLNVNTSALTVDGGGAIYLENIPQFGGGTATVTLYDGNFNFDVSTEELKSTLIDDINNQFDLAGLDVHIDDIEILSDGVRIIGDLNMPELILSPNGANIQAGISTLEIRTTGIGLIGSVGLYDVTIKENLSLKELILSFNTIDNEYVGSTVIITKLVELEASATIINGQLDEVTLAGDFTPDIKLGSTGMALDKANGSLTNLSGQPITVQLGATIVPAIGGELDFVNMEVYGKYTFGTTLDLGGQLNLFNESLANSHFHVENRLMTFNTEASFKGILNGNINAKIQRTNDLGTLMEGNFGADLQMPANNNNNQMPTALYDLLSFKFVPGQVIMGTDNYLNNNKIAGGAKLDISVGGLNPFTGKPFKLFELKNLYYQATWENNDLDFAFGRNYKTINSFPINNLVSYLRFNPSIYKGFVVNTATPSVLIYGKNHNGTQPTVTLFTPDGDSITQFDLDQHINISFIEDSTTNVVFYHIDNPTIGRYAIKLENVDSLEILGASNPPSIRIENITQNSSAKTLNISWIDDDHDEDALIKIGLDRNSSGGDGLIIVDSLSENDISDTYTLDYSDIPIGEYYLYAIIQDSIGQFSVSYYEQPFSLIPNNAPNPPTNLLVNIVSDTIVLNWDTSTTNLVTYNIYYSTDSNTVSYNSPSIGVQDITQVNLSQLTAGLYYEFMVTALDTSFNESQGSNLVSTTYVSLNNNNQPYISTNTTLNIAYKNQPYSFTIQANDADNDPLTYTLESAPSGMTINSSGQISWIPTTNQIGYNPIHIQVTDNQGLFDSLKYQIQVFDTISVKAQIDFNQAYYINYDDNALLTINDPNYQGNNQITDSTSVVLSSNTDTIGIAVIAYETAPSSNEFIVQFGFNETLSSGNQLHVLQKDSIWVQYIDNNPNDTILGLANFIILEAGFESDNSICYGDTLEVLNTSVGSGLTYDWSFGNGQVSNEFEPEYIYPVNYGNDNDTMMVQLIITDIEGRIDTFSKQLIIHDLPLVNLLDTVTVCQVATLDAGNVTSSILWSTTDTTSVISLITSGLYTVEVINIFGCQNNDTSYVKITDDMNIVSNPQNPNCFEIEDGNIDLTVTGSAFPYSYSWSNNTSNEDLLNIGDGNYVVTITDINNCIQIASFGLTNPNLITNTIDTILCQGESYTLLNQVYTTNGTYVDTTSGFNGCDSIITLNLTVNPTQLINQNLTICQGESILIGTIIHNSTGIYTDTLANLYNCDSIVITDLTVNPTHLINQNLTICQGESISVGTIIHNSTGIYTDTLMNIYGCDSIMITDLTVNPTHLINQNLTICQGESISVGMIVHNSTGIYTDTLMNIYGCDSIMITDLTVNPTHLINQNSTICQGESILVGTIIHDSTGIYTDTLVNIYNCDSIIITDLTVNPTQVTNLTDTICHGETLDFNGQIVDTSGTYQVTLQTWQGCDSIVNLDLTVQPSITILNTIIIDGTSIPLGSIDITPSGDTLTQQYLWSNGVTTQDVSSLGTGFYGLTITDNIGCQDTFSFEIGVVNTFFMDNKKQIQVKLYPNPTRENQITTLEFDNILSKDLTYRIVGVDGKILEVGVLSKNELKHQIKVPQVVGMYYLQLFSENRQIKAIPFIVR
jgi:hypothetical protein